MTARLVIFDAATGERRVIPSHQVALTAFLAGSGGRTLTIGRLACCEDDVGRAWPLRSASSSERVRKPVRPGGSLRSHQPAEPGPAPLPHEEKP